MHQAEEPIPSAVGIGHVHLRVANLDRAVAFYRDVLGFALNAYGPDLRVPGAAFLAAGSYHHHVGLNTWESEGARPRRPATRASITSLSSTRTGASCHSLSGASTITLTPSRGPRTTD
jgi:catechol-2,3-dioxygenase